MSCRPAYQRKRLSRGCSNMNQNSSLSFFIFFKSFYHFFRTRIFTFCILVRKETHLYSFGWSVIVWFCRLNIRHSGITMQQSKVWHEFRELVIARQNMNNFISWRVSQTTQLVRASEQKLTVFSIWNLRLTFWTNIEFRYWAFFWTSVIFNSTSFTHLLSFSNQNQIKQIYCAIKSC